MSDNQTSEKSQLYDELVGVIYKMMMAGLVPEWKPGRQAVVHFSIEHDGKIVSVRSTGFLSMHESDGSLIPVEEAA